MRFFDGSALISYESSVMDLTVSANLAMLTKVGAAQAIEEAVPGASHRDRSGLT